jgi:hypothetical protein
MSLANCSNVRVAAGHASSASCCNGVAGTLPVKYFEINVTAELLARFVAAGRGGVSRLGEVIYPA